MYMPVHKTHIDNALASACVCVLPYLVAEHKTAQIIKISHILCGLPPCPSRQCPRRNTTPPCQQRVQWNLMLDQKKEKPNYKAALKTRKQN